MISSMTAAEDPLCRPLFFYCLVVNGIPLKKMDCNTPKAQWKHMGEIKIPNSSSNMGRSHCSNCFHFPAIPSTRWLSNGPVGCRESRPQSPYLAGSASAIRCPQNHFGSHDSWELEGYVCWGIHICIYIIIVIYIYIYTIIYTILIHINPWSIHMIEYDMSYDVSMYQTGDHPLLSPMIQCPGRPLLRKRWGQ